MMNVLILGCTGSIGENTVKVCKDIGYRIIGVTCKTSYTGLADIIERYELGDNLKYIGISDNESCDKFKLLGLNLKAKVFGGEKANIHCIQSMKYDIIVNALNGSNGIEPSYYAVSNCKRLALANKETIVAAGDIILDRAAQYSCQVVPVDSEHGAILQCIEHNPIKRIYITASGGPFWNLDKAQLSKVTVEQALNHPVWKMGTKITIDSATMMNKGFEVIEASKLYNLTKEKIKVLIHPQSIIHSMVEFYDNSIKAQLSTCDMKLHIQYALTYPERINNGYEELDLTEYNLTFHKPDFDKFKCLKLAYEAVKEGNSLGTVINAANDECVEYFLKGKIAFTDIADIIEKVMNKHDNIKAESIEDVLSISDWAKTEARI
ncbi:MAG TPA: 1-deoxy-D-xylulose-5-phosphate reductoisomerase [Clostridia bacterium]|jgi:1-deoxy-D-xylulose-5-phosphate reductoisomerase|nr:1-deoxy-D-xylulose-5-phosphate reductoisomerase [Clostridiaceae bacterium]HOF25820.1 1-deoxy-D-xylulose-5-phosphate reductoisomerase [Clostridia bacterium]HOM33737.1 1-deoxy-D-xylulose-5-phosphate reductoisomerase [Clostridia bacterium]HOR88845.1 1-deoxy-D-xylulose-5-phosphate reductoisomerase [Clostridia bacterium]HOT70979.1 1-deoxy-D-xylulose-5-phosphate reductoisomerase [Clostridia bacterium]